jgi:predicted amidohydrolase YtcJ
VRREAKYLGAMSVVIAMLCMPLLTHAQADLVLHNGKIVTVDDRFTIAQAIAIKGERIIAVGANDAVLKTAGSAAKRIDLKGRTVIPGLIDNHAHFARGSQHWGIEVRWDGVTSRAQALDKLRERAKSARIGEWIVVMGGWSYDQFTDSQTPFSRAELDTIAPNNPIALQYIYVNGVLNSRALDELGLRDATVKIPGSNIERDAQGAPTGILTGAGVSSYFRNKIPMGDAQTQVESVRTHLRDLNAMGLTTSVDWGGYGFTEDWYEPFRVLHRKQALTMRVFHGTWYNTNTAADTDKAVASIRELKAFQGDDMMDRIGYGETVLLPLHDNPSSRGATISLENLALWRRIVQAVAERGMHLSVHANQRESLDAFLTQIEEINRDRPIRGLRWSFAHVRQLNEGQIERMRKLGMAALVHSQATISGAILQRVHGDAALDQPPVRTVQESGISWGLGSDSNGAAPSNPFYTLWWAVTGKMLGGKPALRQTISREQALIAHTRSNAYFVFREGDIGSLQKGKYADLLVLDRDYLTVPPDQIKDITPLITMVGGKIVYEVVNQGKP